MKTINFRENMILPELEFACIIISEAYIKFIWIFAWLYRYLNTNDNIRMYSE